MHKLVRLKLIRFQNLLPCHVVLEDEFHKKGFVLCNTLKQHGDGKQVTSGMFTISLLHASMDKSPSNIGFGKGLADLFWGSKLSYFRHKCGTSCPNVGTFACERYLNIIIFFLF